MSKKGWIDLTLDHDNCLFFAKPSGFIYPELIKKDLVEARLFGQKVKRNWTYIVDTSDVKFAHPFNIFYLRKVSKLPYIDKFYVIAPSFIIQVLQKVMAPLLKVSKVFKSSKELDLFLDTM